MTSGQNEIAEDQYPDDNLPNQPSDGTTGNDSLATIATAAGHVVRIANMLRLDAIDAQATSRDTNMGMSLRLRVDRQIAEIVELAHEMAVAK